MNLKIPIILASESPQRRELLASLGLEFTSVGAAIDEIPPVGLGILQVPEHLARQKAEVVGSEHPAALIIAADTVVVLENTILGKPKDEGEAIQMLGRLSNKTHQVVTGVCLKYHKKMTLFRDITLVTFGMLSDKEIEYYVNTYRPLDKAGAYGIQEWIGMIGVTGIEGSYFNVVGLPVQKLYEQLDGFEL